ncbi:MAG: tRNA glutamyl-Q(34) synthetase GluQRS [Acidobacteria bacterium]|nr:tRNA glutamyl-Q(34) synthetase GluQRS [Acidobacteriota bacterium]
MSQYRGRLAPSPTGYLHLGHAHTFLIAAQRATEAGGTLVVRNEDLDRRRCRAQFVTAMLEDLRWLGIVWQEGPDQGGTFGPYSQSERQSYYREAWQELYHLGLIYPCSCSRRDLALAASAPQDGDDEAIYPGTCRTKTRLLVKDPSDFNWRFRIPEGKTIQFRDGCQGDQRFTAGTDFGDFLIWRKDGVPAYQLAVVVDDHAMKISEVVRGRDLLKSTARQLLLCHALGFARPRFYHCNLVCDDRGVRLAKRHDALSLRRLRENGLMPEEIRTRVLSLGQLRENSPH